MVSEVRRSALYIIYYLTLSLALQPVSVAYCGTGSWGVGSESWQIPGIFTCTAPVPTDPLKKATSKKKEAVLNLPTVPEYTTSSSTL